MGRVALGLVLLGSMGLAAQATELSPLADRLHWCGSAFYWLSTDAFDAGNDAEGEQYAGWSDDLAARADMALEAEGRTKTEIAAIRDDYDNRVITEMGADGARYDVTACPELVAGQ